MTRLRSVIVVISFVFVSSVYTVSGTTETSEFDIVYMVPTVIDTDVEITTTVAVKYADDYRKCEENEIPTTCFEAICERRHCSDLDQTITCSRLDPMYCTRGCICKDTFLRAENGTCIPTDDCPGLKNDIRCRENETLSDCVNSMCNYKSCSEIGQPIECIRMSRKFCKKGCICNYPFLRTDDGACVPKKDCPSFKICSNPNEYYDLCPSPCPARTCVVDDRATVCPEPLLVGDPNCPPAACKCNVGYYRDINGICVTWNLCNSTSTFTNGSVTTS